MVTKNNPGGSLARILLRLLQHRNLICEMTKREVHGRYRGSMIGLLWSLLKPAFMLAVYTFVFGVVFKANWGWGATRTAFAIILFAGVIVQTFFAECIQRAPSLILENANYVKNVVFPLEILPFVVVLSALFHAAISMLVLLAALGLCHPMHPATLLIPLIFFPFALVTLGFSWLLAATGVYVRDILQMTGIMTTIILFLSPVFYPVAALPEQWRAFMHCNPLTFVIEETRRILLGGGFDHWVGLGLYYGVGLLVAWFGFLCFQKMRHGFAAVL